MPQNRGPVPSGFGGHSRLLLLELQRVFCRVHNNRINDFVMHDAIHLTEERRPAVPILKAPPKQSKNESLQLRVSTEFKFKLQRYAEFLEATPSYVVIEALNRIFDKDRDFKAWLGKQPQSDNKMQSENIFIMETTKKS